MIYTNNDIQINIFFVRKFISEQTDMLRPISKKGRSISECKRNGVKNINRSPGALSASLKFLLHKYSSFSFQSKLMENGSIDLSKISSLIRCNLVPFRRRKTHRPFERTCRGASSLYLSTICGLLYK